MRTFVITTHLIIVICLFLIACTSFAFEREDWATEAYQKNKNSVVFIQGDKVEERRKNSADAERTFNGMGTGIIIDERGYILTNFHVVKDIREVQVTTYDQRPQNSVEHKPYIAEVVAVDPETDLAIIKVNTRSPLRPISFGRSHDLMPGELCMAIGNPYGYEFSLTDGRISNINREVGVNDSPLVYRNAIQTNTAINPGNSGGPLFNINGEMIGVNVAIRQGAANIAFAIPVDQVIEIAAELIGGLADKQVMHGLTISQIEPSNFDSLSVKRFILKVEAVESNSPAALAGIQKGDMLTGIGSYTLRNKLDFYRALLSLRANEDVAFSFLRNGELLDASVAVRSPRGGGVVAASRSSSPSPASATVAPKTASNPVTNGGKVAEWDKLVWENLGIEYAEIPAQEYKRMYSQFTINEADVDFSSGGIVVKAVRKGSPAAQVWIQPGDIIVSIDPRIAGVARWVITSANDIRFVGAQEWQKYQSQTNSIKVDVIRENEHYAAEIPTTR